MKYRTKTLIIKNSTLYMINNIQIRVIIKIINDIKKVLLKIKISNFKL